MKSKSILILSATAGAGHVRAGEALAAAAEESHTPVAIRHDDILSYTSPVFRKYYGEVYTTIVQKSPELWDFLYERTRTPGKGNAKSPLIRIFDNFNYRKYLRMLETNRPDAVLCTHFLPYVAISDRLKSPSWTIPFFSVPTDYEVHTLWIDPSIRKYYAATEEAAWTLQSAGVPADRILVTGIPVLPVFGRPPARNRAARGLSINPRTFTIMILSGGYGIGVVDKLVPALAGFLGKLPRRKFQLLVVCGRNAGLHKILSGLGLPANVSMTLFGFISDIEKLMAASDLLISKSGALSTTEAVTCRLPMILFGTTPGQESHNATYFVENGTALRATSVHNVLFKVGRILDEPDRLHSMQEKAGLIRRPSAADDIIEDVLTAINTR
jgi:processive 1,2-diacylglycerol beta-glucosyltransferase